MQRNRSIPPVQVIPVLIYPDVRAAVAWLGEAFGFVEHTRIGEDHRAQLRVGDSGAVILADASGEKVAPDRGRVTHEIKVRVDDADAVFERARAAGARVVQEPTEHMYGERECSLEDLAGHRWQFSHTVRDVAPEEYGCQTVRPWPQYSD